MRRAFDLAYATAYVFAGCRPRFLEVGQVAFTIPVNVGDLTSFQGTSDLRKCTMTIFGDLIYIEVKKRCSININRGIGMGRLTRTGIGKTIE